MVRLVTRLGGLMKGRGSARLLRAFGLTVVPFIGAAGNATGVRLQWEPDEPGIHRGTIVEASIAGRDMRFFVVNERDEIQSRHRKGEFYEQEELDIIAQHFNGGVFVDAGANVGNHSLYALAFLDAAKVIAFEPLPAAAQLLAINIALNGFQDRFDFHPCGLSDRQEFAHPDSDPRKIDNLGATRLSAASEGLELIRADDVIEERVDFIKIDTEGYELKVLDGLRRTIEQSRPPLFVEVDDRNLSEFKVLLAELGYVVVNDYRRYPGNINLLAISASDGSKAGR